AIGAGLAFAAVCDIIMAAEGATFGTTEIKVGLLGASAQLSLLVGRHKARELFFTGELVTATELQRLGAVRTVVPQADLMDAARCPRRSRTCRRGCGGGTSRPPRSRPGRRPACGSTPAGRRGRDPGAAGRGPRGGRARAWSARGAARRRWWRGRRPRRPRIGRRCG